MKFKLKVYPITEDGEVIYQGGMADVVRIEFDTGDVYVNRSYNNSLLLLTDCLLGGCKLDCWNVKDNRDGRDSINELYVDDDGVLTRIFL